MKTRRPAGAYLLGLDGVGAEIPGWACDWLERQTNLHQQRVNLRGIDPSVDEVLQAIRYAAMSWRGSESGSASGTSLPDSPELAPLSEVSSLLDTATAGGLIGISDRAVRKAIRSGRLHGQQIGGRWMVTREDAERYRRRTA